MNLINAKNLLISLIKIREVEKVIANGRKEGLIGGPVHLCIGQEAIPAGISLNLTDPHDGVYGCHRSHGHIISLDCSIYKLFCEVLGKFDGLAKGYGGSMHLIDKENKFYGSVPIVAGTIPLGVGYALANKLKKNNGIGVVYLGDGATEEGVVYESLNMSAILEIPVLFVVENNLYSSHLHISERQKINNCTKLAQAAKVKSEQIDGNCVKTVYEAAKELIEYIRKNKKPAFLEGLTYRWLGHVDWREDLDVGISRTFDEINEWKLKDPIKRHREFMIENYDFSQKDFLIIEEELREMIYQDWDKAKNSSSSDTIVITEHTI